MEQRDVTRKFQKELNAGTISLAVLGLMVRERRPMYGYEIGKALDEHARGNLPMNQGALYPVLRTMEKNGLLTSEIQPSDAGPPRRYYRATASGRRCLRRWRDVWTTTRRFVESILED